MWVFAAIGVVSLAIGVAVALRGMRTHHRGTHVALFTAALVGLPLAAIAPFVAASLILWLTTRGGTVDAPDEWVVFAAVWAALAAPGLVLGPLATWWIAHRLRHLPGELANDEATLAKYERTTLET